MARTRGYVQWNGDMANAFDVGVPWIMCNGEAANNTINTCNGNDCTGFINSNGQNGRILIDQPALWTENEGWFESWETARIRRAVTAIDRQRISVLLLHAGLRGVGRI